jgi:hypothetical protein
MENRKQKTVVEWYSNAVNDILISKQNNKINDELLIQNLLNANIQAKQIYKEQIKDAFNAGMNNSVDYFILFLDNNDESEVYYNETFKTK